MKTISINTFEDLHHLCLMYGLKKAYMRYPFLARDILATPPPLRRNPDRRRIFPGTGLNPVCVQYYNRDVVILYDEAKVTDVVAAEFAKAVMEEYLHLRHPYMKTQWVDMILVEATTQTRIAGII